MLEKARKLRLLDGSPRVRGHKAGKVLRVGGAVVGAEGLDQPAKKELSRVDEGA
jgi:hypothetical protein